MAFKTLELKEFKGVDHRLNREIADQLTVLVADNVDLKVGGGFKSRDQLRLAATLDTRSFGLYSLGGKLHAAMPYEAGYTVELVPDPFTYDIFTPTKGVKQVSSVCSWDNRAYLCIQKDQPGAPAYEHHYCSSGETSGAIWLSATGVTGGSTSTLQVTSEIPITQDYQKVGATISIPARGVVRVVSSVNGLLTVTPAVNSVVEGQVFASALIGPRETVVKLPFIPGASVITLAGKVFASDSITNNVSFSSTKNGPFDWILADDAGFIATANNADGSRPILAFSAWFNKLVVFNESSAQVWNVDPDPANMAFFATVGGAGMRQPNAVANVQGDLIFFGRKAFRSISSNQYTGQPKTQNGIGIAIKDLTEAISPDTGDMKSLWFPAGDKYLCTYKNKMFVFTAAEEKQGWTTYTLPFEVSDIAEHDNQVYVRKANSGEVYVFDENYEQEPDFTFDLRTQFLMGDADNIVKQWKILSVVGTGGPVSVDFGIDSSDDSAVRKGFTLSNGTTQSKGRYPILITDPSVQVRMSGHAKWDVDALFLYYESGAIL